MAEHGMMARCNIDAGEFQAITRTVQSHARALEALAGIPASVQALRESVGTIGDKLAEVGRDVASLNAWRSDDKVERITALEREIAKRDELAAYQAEATARDRLDFRRSVRSALLSALFTLIFVTIPALIISWHLTRGPSAPQSSVQVHP